MSSVTAAENSKYYSRRGQGSAEIKEGAGHGPKQLVQPKSSVDSALLSNDNVDLSRTAQELLHEVHGRAEEIVEEFPQYRHALLGGSSLKGNDQQQGVLVLSRAQAFLRNPHYNKLTEKNPEFNSFYQRVAQLGAHAQHILEKTREHYRTESNATYLKALS